jgi:hypothetical protein
MSSYSGSLVTAKKVKAKCTAYFMQHSTEKSTYIKVAYFSNIYYHTLFQGPILNCASVAPTSQVHASTMLLLLITGNK